MRIVVTGADGFVGTHVVNLAIRSGHDVHAFYRTMPRDRRHDLLGEWAADLTQEWPLDDEIDGVIHLAGLAAVGPSFDSAQTYITANTAMMSTLGEALLRQGNERARVVAVSTGALYSTSPGPRDESRAIAMTSPYAVSKAAVELQCKYYRSRGLDIVVARPFNHIGPGQSPGFILPDLYGALRALPLGDALTVGNLDTRRDYTDVRDVALAYIDLLSAPEVGPLYNIASGKSVSGREILSAICCHLGREIPQTVVDKGRLRPNDAAEIVGDAGRLRNDVGWTPSIPIEASVRDFLSSSMATAPAG